ncbi:hypothetical protein Tco_0232373 [Tanacetum coccineum]
MVSEEALTFCSRYLKDDVETRFNRLGRNDDGLPEEEPDKFQVFWSVCKLTGRMKETRLTTDVRQAVVWFVLNNSPEVDADILAYREELPDNVETSFPAWFNHKRSFNTQWLEGEIYYGQLEEILELTYIGHRKVVLFRCKHGVLAPRSTVGDAVLVPPNRPTGPVPRPVAKVLVAY